MCSYFEQYLRKHSLNPFPGSGHLPAEDIRRRIRPTQPAWTLDAQGPSERRWSMLPPWAKEPKLKYPTFNARAETVSEKPVFRHAWKHAQRCLIPASAFFEWPLLEGAKIRHAIRRDDAAPLYLAGLWEIWRGPEQTIESCTILTVDAREDLRWVHARMPRLLNPEELDVWLHAEPEAAAELLSLPYTGALVAAPDADPSPLGSAQ